MDQDKKMTEMILNHTLEIIRLLTGEDVSKSLKLSELNMDKKMILNHSLEIIHLLTGEVPLKCGDVAVYFSMEEWEYIEGHKELYMDVMMESHQDLDIPGLAGAQDGNHLEAVSVKEEEEDTREEFNAEATEDLCVRSQLDTPEQEISDNIRTGRVNVKPAIISNMERGEEPYVRGHQEVKEEQMDRDPNEADGPGTRNILGVHNISISSPDCVMEVSSVSHGCPGANTMNKETRSRNLNPSIVPQKRLHTGESLHILSDCGEGFTSDKVYVNYQNIEETHTCTVCGECFTSQSELRNHERVHRTEKPFACSECGKCFARKAYLVEHKRVHTGEKPFACSQCGKCFTQKGSLINHQRCHTRERPFACSECGKCFTLKGNLVTHQKCHTVEKPFTCPECGKCFTEQESLVTHRRCHTGEKPYACSVCGNGFTQKKNLITHQKCHTGEKPFACSECGKSFAQKSYLVAHKRVHTGEKPFACSQCEKCFTQKGSLVKHQESHTGEKLFGCS